MSGGGTWLPLGNDCRETALERKLSLRTDSFEDSQSVAGESDSDCLGEGGKGMERLSYWFMPHK